MKRHWHRFGLRTLLAGVTRLDVRLCLADGHCHRSLG